VRQGRTRLAVALASLRTTCGCAATPDDDISPKEDEEEVVDSSAAAGLGTSMADEEKMQALIDKLNSVRSTPTRPKKRYSPQLVASPGYHDLDRG
jgi:hypothetical protein